MNISLNNMNGFTATTGFIKGKVQVDQKFVKEEAKKTDIEKWVDSFKEQNTPQDRRIKEIYNKFKAGKELSPAEIDYLAKNSPDLYKEVREIMQEREAMELKMKMAETQAEVTSICMNEMTKVQSMLSAGDAEGQSEKLMARANQIADAQQKFMASAEYKAKEDTKSQNEEVRKHLEELESQQEATQNTGAEESAVEQSNLSETGEQSKVQSTEMTETSETDETTEENNHAVETKHPVKKKNTQAPPTVEFRGIVIDSKA